MPWASRTLGVAPSVLGAFTSIWQSPVAPIPDVNWERLPDRPTRRVEGRADLPEQLLTGVGLRDKPAKPLRQHGADLVLLGKSAAQHDVNTWVNRLQFLEHSIPIHHWQEEVQDNQANFTMDLLEDFQRLETVPGDDDLVSFLRQNCGGELRNFRFIIDDQDQFARAIRIQDRNFRWHPWNFRFGRFLCFAGQLYPGGRRGGRRDARARYFAGSILENHGHYAMKQCLGRLRCYLYLLAKLVDVVTVALLPF